jgi:anti-anti-sigma regulatory factor
MDAPQGIFRVSRLDQAILFQVEGRATMSQSLAFRKCAEHYLCGETTALRIDLRRCVHMDSTFLGTLLHIRRAMACRGHGELTLVSPSPPCCRILAQMALADLFVVVEEEEPLAAVWTEITGDLQDVGAFKRNIVQAHRELAKLPGPAGEPFRAVVRALAQEPEGRQEEEAAGQPGAPLAETVRQTRDGSGEPSYYL